MRDMTPTLPGGRRTSRSRGCSVTSWRTTTRRWGPSSTPARPSRCGSASPSHRFLIWWVKHETFQQREVIVLFKLPKILSISCHLTTWLWVLWERTRHSFFWIHDSTGEIGTLLADGFQKYYQSIQSWPFLFSIILLYFSFCEDGVW